MVQAIALKMAARNILPRCTAFELRIFNDSIDLLAILQKSLDRATFSYILIHEARLSGVRASISIVHIRKFY